MAAPTSSSAGVPFSAIERRLACYLRALWGRPATLRDAGRRARVSIVAGAICMPNIFPAGAGEGIALHRAAAAHAAAHLVHSMHRFPLAKLRPIQVAIVSLIEDARIERLAWQDLPGLRRLWLRFHVALPDAIPNATSLMARLARALIDPDYRDHDGWVAKGRELFEAHGARLHDPSMSREIGALLGNDLGQMRMQFDYGRYLVEPAYRDDNAFLWEFPENKSAPPPESEPAVLCFDSSGREDVGYYRFKDFDEPYAEGARARLAAMTGQRSTRMGAALRHAGHLLSQRRTARKLIVLVTDGAPHDIDVHDRWYLALDAKRAVDEQRRAGIATFCVSLDPGADAYVTRIFGAGNYLVLDHLRRLPEKLALVYLRWAAA